MTEEEFRAVFDIYAEKREIPRRVRSWLQENLLKRHIDDIKRLDSVSGLFGFLDRILPKVIEELDILPQKIVVFGVLAFWGMLALKFPADQYTEELQERLEAVCPQLVDLLVQFLKERGIDLLAIHGVEDPEIAQRFKTILEEGGWRPGEERGGEDN